MKNLYISIFVFFIFIFKTAFSDGISDSCEYKDKFEECKKANKSGTTREIEDFICISTTDDERMLSQIILDVEFKKLDKELRKELDDVETSKDLFFGTGSEENIVEGIDYYVDRFGDNGYYWEKYMETCDDTRNKTIECFGGQLSQEGAKRYFLDGDFCKKFVKTKLKTITDVTISTLKLNKMAVDNDLKKSNMQVLREKYSFVLDLFYLNIGYLERIWKKWPSKVKDAEGK